LVIDFHFDHAGLIYRYHGAMRLCLFDPARVRLRQLDNGGYFIRDESQHVEVFHRFLTRAAFTTVSTKLTSAEKIQRRI
jgi:hypothetical protein